MERHSRWLPIFLAVWMVLASALYAYGAPFKWNSFSGMREDKWFVAMPDAYCSGVSDPLRSNVSLTVLEVNGATPLDGWVMWAFHDGLWIAAFYIDGEPYSWSHGTWDSDTVKVIRDDLPIADISDPCSWHDVWSNVT